MHKTNLASRQGEKFLAVLPDLQHAIGALSVHVRIARIFEASFHSSGYELTVTLNNRHDMLPNDGPDFDALLKCTNLAFHDAKAAGHNLDCHIPSNPRLARGSPLMW
jgi:GGDEF domain-containing protein